MIQSPWPHDVSILSLPRPGHDVAGPPRGELAIDDQGLRLIIRDFESLTFRQVEYGDDSKIHHFEYFTGEVAFEDFLTPIEAATDAAAPWVRVLDLLARVSR